MGQDTQDMLNRFKRSPDLFASSATFADFAAAVGGGEGANLARYVGGWADYSFRTAKAHGLENAPGKPLYCPEARKLSDLIEDVRFIPTPVGGLYRDEARRVVGGRTYISTMGREGGDMAPRYSVGARYDFSPDWLARGERIRRRSGGVDHATYARPTKVLRDAFGVSIDNADTLSTLELIKWQDGRTLAIARHDEGIFTMWAAVLDPGAADAVALMPEEDRALIAAERAGMAKAWPDVPAPVGWFRVAGEDRQQGALGICEPFETRVKAAGLTDARALATLQRYAAGREHVLCISVDPED